MAKSKPKPRQSYPCDICHRTFNKSEHVIRHMRIHTNEKPYKCDICKKSYARGDTLARHLKSHETDNEVHEDEDVGAANPQSTFESHQTSSLLYNETDQFDLGIDFLEDLDFTEYQVPENFDFTAFDNSIGQIPGQLDSSFLEQPSVSNIRVVERDWFSHPDTTLSNTHMPENIAGPSLVDSPVDEGFRLAVQDQLVAPPLADAAPSVAFLNRCIQLFILKVSHLLPMIHVPTFRPSRHNALLVYSISLFGSQLIGTAQAASSGHRMFESLHRVIISSWMSLVSGDRDKVSTIQAIVFSQVFALLSSNPNHSLTALCFHGTVVVSFQRFSKLWLRSNLEGNIDTDSTSETRQRKRKIAQEVFDRIENVLRMQDVELSALYHQSPLMRTNRRNMQSRMDSSRIENGQHDDSRDLFLTYRELILKLSRVLEERCSSYRSPHFEELENDLNNWIMRMSPTLPQASPLHLDLLWHSCWLVLLCDINNLEVACGRDSLEDVPGASTEATTWATSTDAGRALVHAWMILQRLGRVIASEVPAIHVPRIAYHAGLVFYCAAIFSENEDSIMTQEKLRAIDKFSDITTLQRTGIFTHVDAKTFLKECGSRSQLRDQTCTSVALLRRAGVWGISLNLAQTLEALVAKDFA